MEPTDPFADRRALAAVAGVGSVLAGAAAFIIQQPALHHALVPVPWWTLPFLILGYAAVERLVFFVEYRKEAFTYTVMELPTAFALVFFPLHWAVAARLIGGLLVVALVWRSTWYKLLFNAGVFSFELAIGYAAFHTIELDNGKLAGTDFLWLGLTLVTVTLLGSCLTILAISFFEGGFFRLLLHELKMTIVPVMTAGLSVAAVATALYFPYLLPLPLMVFGLLWHMLRLHGRTAQRLRDLEEMHRLSGVVGRSLHRAEVASFAIDEVQRLLRVTRVSLVLFGADGAEGPDAVHVVSVGDVFEDLPTSAHDERWAAWTSQQGSSLVDERSLREAGITTSGAFTNRIVSTVHDEDGIIGVFVVGERVGVSDRFDDGDAIRASAIADRVGLALRNARLHEQIEHEAWHDPLTGLVNRTHFERLLEEVLDSSDPTDRVAVVLFEVDQFRDVNSTLGHQAGDKLLVDLAKRLGDVVGESAIRARMGGDEFALVLEVTEPAEAERIALKIADSANTAFVLDEFDIVVTLSVGVAVCSTPAINAASMLRRAEMAMHWAKSHHTSVEVYRGEIDRRTPERLSLLSDLRSALEHQDIEAFYQPKLDLVTRTVVGAEALVRWRHPTRGMVPPLDFIHLAETTGLITMVTNQILRKSVSTIRLLDDLGFDLSVSVNLSTMDLLDETIVGRVERILRDNRVQPDQLTLEITETALLADGSRSMETVEGLRGLGVHLSIDDFGTGFSSLSYLRSLPATELKVDRSFVTNMLLDERDEVIVRSTIDLGHNLGMKVAAEGVEDQATLERLRSLGCELAQGYELSPPLPFDRFLVWLNSGRYPAARRHEQAPLAHIG
ncbi:MAG: putative bifunctional diguanylate cyclase/phosphodiesterase [Ilumatobacteraceae bacterium]